MGRVCRGIESAGDVVMSVCGGACRAETAVLRRSSRLRPDPPSWGTIGAPARSRAMSGDIA